MFSPHILRANKLQQHWTARSCNLGYRISTFSHAPLTIQVASATYGWRIVVLGMGEKQPFRVKASCTLYTLLQGWSRGHVVLPNRLWDSWLAKNQFPKYCESRHQKTMNPNADEDRQSWWDSAGTRDLDLGKKLREIEGIYNYIPVFLRDISEGGRKKRVLMGKGRINTLQRSE